MTLLRSSWAIGAVGTVASLLAFNICAAAAVDFPAHPLRLIVPSAPSGNGDIMARPLAQRLDENRGQPQWAEVMRDASVRVDLER